MLPLFLAASVLCAGSVQARCPGDCSGAGEVTLRDLLVVVVIALGLVRPSHCPAADADGDARVTVDELLAVVRSALHGCPAAPTPTATPRPSETAVATATAAPTQTATLSWTPAGTETATQTATRTHTEVPTATPGVNRPPVVPLHDVYRTFPGHSIRLPVDAVDPEGDPVHCSASPLPEGARLTSGEIFEWTPEAGQLGPFYVRLTCSDQAEPPAQAQGVLTFKVQPPDLCAPPRCDPLTGCQVLPPPVDEPCCDGEPLERVAEPEAPCPAGRVLLVGRNTVGFGPLRNCDLLRIRNTAQIGATALLHFKTRCVDASQPVLVHARMETAERGVVFDLVRRINLRLQDDGFARRRFVDFPIDNPPYFDLQDAEANLYATVTDVAGNQVSESLRLKLTFTPVPDLPDPMADAAPAATPSP